MYGNVRRYWASRAWITWTEEKKEEMDETTSDFFAIVHMREWPNVQNWGLKGAEGIVRKYGEKIKIHSIYWILTGAVLAWTSKGKYTQSFAFKKLKGTLRRNIGVGIRESSIKSLLSYLETLYLTFLICYFEILCSLFWSGKSRNTVLVACPMEPFSQDPLTLKEK